MFRFQILLFYNVLSDVRKEYACVDWNAAREDYIRDESCSYRILSKKYGVAVATICKHAKDEKWAEQREQLKNKTVMKSLEKISDKKAKQAAAYTDMVDTMTAKLTAAIESVDPKDTTAVRRLTASLCDLKELLGIKSDADSREQEARIANLRRQADREDEDNAPTLIVEGLPEEFKV